ncbi:MAG TPA: hypothetical protein VK643_10130 [Burkholderiales bacterium]|nr:hypothetical protein [Burkholderiales bacterium]
MVKTGFEQSGKAVSAEKLAVQGECEAVLQRSGKANVRQRAAIGYKYLQESP